MRLVKEYIKGSPWSQSEQLLVNKVSIQIRFEVQKQLQPRLYYGILTWIQAHMSHIIWSQVLSQITTRIHNQVPDQIKDLILSILREDER